MSHREDGNLLGRVIAVALIAGAAYGVRAIACGSGECPLGERSCCEFAAPASPAAPSAPSAPAAR